MAAAEAQAVAEQRLLAGQGAAATTAEGAAACVIALLVNNVAD